MPNTPVTTPTIMSTGKGSPSLGPLKIEKCLLDESTYELIFQLLPCAACLIDSKTYKILDVNEKFEDSIFESNSSVGHGFPSTILDLKGRVDFLFACRNMKENGMTSQVVEELRTRSSTEKATGENSESN